MARKGIFWGGSLPTQTIRAHVVGALIVCCIVGSPSQAQPVEGNGDGYATLGALQRFQEEPSGANFEAILQTLPTVVRPNQDAVYVVDSDIGMNRQGVCRWVATVTQTVPRADAGCGPVRVIEKGDVPSVLDDPELRAIKCEDQITLCIWSREDRNLTYAFDEPSFVGTPGHPGPLTALQYAVFKKEFVAAADAWWKTEAKCPLTECNLNIVYVPTEDRKPDRRSRVKFDVTFDTALPAGTVALAFFPRGVHQLEQRVQVGKRFKSFWNDQTVGANGNWTTPLQWRHTLRHEIGHILGYAHEQHANDSACRDKHGRLFALPRESKLIDNLTKQDKKSIMFQSRCYGADQSDKLTMTGKLSEDDVQRHLRYYSQ